jgi:hypothetical protein
VRPAILPDWWNEASAQDPNLLPDIEIRIARFLRLPLSSIRNPAIPLTPPSYPGAQLRRVRDIDRDRLAPAIHSAIQIAGAVVRSLRNTPTPNPPPTDGLVWRSALRRDNTNITLNDILTDLWSRGIPVIPLEYIPSPSFQGIACIAEGRPVILLGHTNDEPGRLAFWGAHEAGHIAAGDCSPDHPVVDEEENIEDDADIERKADLYASQVLVGRDSIPIIEGEDYKKLASRASELEQTSGVDASQIIFAWASRSHDYATATMAVKALYRGSGARQQLRHHFDLHINLDTATESDRSLLRCVYGEPDQNAITG